MECDSFNRAAAAVSRGNFTELRTGLPSVGELSKERAAELEVEADDEEEDEEEGWKRKGEAAAGTYDEIDEGVSDDDDDEDNDAADA